MFPDQALGEGAVLQPGVGSEAAQSSSQGQVARSAVASSILPLGLDSDGTTLSLWHVDGWPPGVQERGRTQGHWMQLRLLEARGDLVPQAQSGYF